MLHKLVGATFISAIFCCSIALAETGKSTKSAVTPNHHIPADGHRGFNYDEVPPPEPEPEVVEEEPLPPLPSIAAPPSEPTPFSAKWLQKNLQELRLRALDQPTEENVRAYKYAEKIMFDKSHNFGKMSVFVSTTDPYLNENTRIPINSFGARLALKEASDQAKRDFVKTLRDRAGLWVFFDPDCMHCVTSLPAIQHMQNSTGLTVFLITKDTHRVPPLIRQHVTVMEDRGQSASLKVKVWPTYVLAVPPSDYLVIGQGAMTIEDLFGNIITASTERGLIDQETLKKINPIENNIFTTEQIAGIQTKAANEDPTQLMNTFIDSLGAENDQP